MAPGGDAGPSPAARWRARALDVRKATRASPEAAEIALDVSRRRRADWARSPPPREKLDRAMDEALAQPQQTNQPRELTAADAAFRAELAAARDAGKRRRNGAQRHMGAEEQKAEPPPHKDEERETPPPSPPPRPAVGAMRTPRTSSSTQTQPPRALDAEAQTEQRLGNHADTQTAQPSTRNVACAAVTTTSDKGMQALPAWRDATEQAGTSFTDGTAPLDPYARLDEVSAELARWKARARAAEAMLKASQPASSQARIGRPGRPPSRSPGRHAGSRPPSPKPRERPPSPVRAVEDVQARAREMATSMSRGALDAAARALEAAEASARLVSQTAADDVAHAAALARALSGVEAECADLVADMELAVARLAADARQIAGVARGGVSISRRAVRMLTPAGGIDEDVRVLQARDGNVGSSPSPTMESKRYSSRRTPCGAL